MNQLSRYVINEFLSYELINERWSTKCALSELVVFLIYFNR